MTMTSAHHSYAAVLGNIQEELLRVTSQTGPYHTFTAADGTKVQGATESDVKEHLVGRFGVPGRKHRFPGVTNGWEFGPVVEAAGFRFLAVRNYRNQPCRIVTL